MSDQVIDWFWVSLTFWYLISAVWVFLFLIGFTLRKGFVMRVRESN